MANLKTHWTAALTIASVTLLTPAPPSYAQQGELRMAAAEPITYFISEGPPESGFRDGDRTLAEWAFEAWGRQTDPPMELVAGPEASATIRVYWVAAGAGMYGEMRARRVGGHVVADVFISPDTDGLGLDIAQRGEADPLFRDTIVYLTCVHEIGHAFGLNHTRTFQDIMYSFQYGGDFVAYFMRFREKLGSWNDIQQTSPFSVGDVDVFRSLYP